MVESDFLLKVCRICANESSGVLIFSEEGKKNCLEEKIKRFLSITVTEKDALPKVVCPSCSSKLKDMDVFAAMAIKSQKKLQDCLGSEGDEKSFDADTAEDRKELAEHMAQWQAQFTCSPPLLDDDDEDVQPAEDEITENSGDAQANGDDNKGSLLHSILTNGSGSVGGGNGCSEELEVRLDPMLFLGDEDDEAEPSRAELTPCQITPYGSEASTGAQLMSLADNKPYQCSMCHRGFHSDLGLQNHMWSHLPFPRRLSPLTSHFRTEAGSVRNKSYQGGCQCSVCGRVYPTMSTLRAHQITHSNLRPHKCSLCEKTFKRNQDLKFHINQHTGERPYRCPYCPKAFASSGNCFSHRKRMHPKQLARDKKQRLLAAQGK